MKLYKSRFSHLYFVGGIKEPRGRFFYGVAPWSFIIEGKPKNLNLCSKNYKKIKLKHLPAEAIMWLSNIEYLLLMG